MNAKNLIGGIFAGVAVGVAVGMLLAPESGVNTQQKLVKGLRKLGGSLKKGKEDSHQSVDDNFNTNMKEGDSGIDFNDGTRRENG